MEGGRQTDGREGENYHPGTEPFRRLYQTLQNGIYGRWENLETSKPLINNRSRTGRCRRQSAGVRMGRGRDGGRQADRREGGMDGENYHPGDRTLQEALSNSTEWNIRRMGKPGNQ